MRWMLGGDWPVAGGSQLIPVGTNLEGIAGPAGELADAPTWNGTPLPMPMPLNVVVLDEEAALLMLRWYPDHQWYRLYFGPGIDREAIMARARELVRWPRGH